MTPFRSTRPTRLVPVLAALLAAACGGENASVSSGISEAVVRDSAGVTLVENARLPEGAGGWSLGAEPTVEIGVLEGDAAYQLYNVRDARRLPDGRLAILDGGSSRVRIYGPDGVHQADWGGEGEGPGEFGAPQALVAWAGDSLAVWDGRFRRLTVFGLDGSLGRTVPLPSVEGLSTTRYADVLADGTLVVSSTQFDGTPASGRIRMPVAVAVVEPEGALVASLGTHPGAESVMYVTPQTVNIFRNPYLPQYVLTATDDQVLIAQTERFEWGFWGLDGGLDRVVRLDEPRHVVTDAERAAELEQSLADVPEERRAGVRRTWEEVPMPDTLNAMETVVVDRTGHVWVRAETLASTESPAPWFVTDPTGQAVARMTLPARLQVYDIGPDWLLGVTTDDLDVERVQLWPLRRTTP